MGALSRQRDPAARENDVQPRYPHGFRASEFAAIAAGGVVGALARHAGELLLPSATQGLPWATFLENISGSFLLGFTAAFLARRSRNPLLSPFLLVGVFGSYTTFSTFAVGFWERIDAGLYALAWTYSGATLALGLIAVWLGHWCGSTKGASA